MARTRDVRGVIRVNRLVDGKVESDETDRTAIFRHAARLDILCKRAGLPEFSSFMDTTTLAGGSAGTSRPAGMAQLWLLVAREGEWFEPAGGLEMLDGLIAVLEKEPQRFGLFPDRYPQVLEELTSCRDSVADCVARGALFHLGVLDPSRGG